jgi:hypothetical protein
METGGTTSMVTARFPACLFMSCKVTLVKMKTTSLLPIKMDEIEFSHSRRLYK